VPVGYNAGRCTCADFDEDTLEAQEKETSLVIAPPLLSSLPHAGKRASTSQSLDTDKLVHGTSSRRTTMRNSGPPPSMLP
jgi:hypothetical protein